MTTREKVIGGILLGIVIITTFIFSGMQLVMFYERFGQLAIASLIIFFFASSGFFYLAITHSKKAEKELNETITKMREKYDS